MKMKKKSPAQALIAMKNKMMMEKKRRKKKSTRITWSLKKTTRRKRLNLKKMRTKKNKWRGWIRMNLTWSSSNVMRFLTLTDSCRLGVRVGRR